MMIVHSLLEELLMICLFEMSEPFHRTNMETLEGRNIWILERKVPLTEQLNICLRVFLRVSRSSSPQGRWHKIFFLYWTSLLLIRFHSAAVWRMNRNMKMGWKSLMTLPGRWAFMQNVCFSTQSMLFLHSNSETTPNCMAPCRRRPGADIC